MRGFDRYPWGMRWLIFLILGLSGAAHAQGPVRPNHDYLVVASNRARHPRMLNLTLNLTLSRTQSRTQPLRRFRF